MISRSWSARPLRRLIFGWAALAAAVLLLGSDELSATTPSAGAISVDTLKSGVTDDGECTLEEAIKSANADAAPTDAGGQDVDDCVVGAGADAINITEPGEIAAPADGFRITSNMTIRGHADGTTIRGGGGFKVILSTRDAASATAVTLSHMTVTGVSGNGVYVEDQSVGSARDRVDVTLKNMDISSNGTGIVLRGEYKSRRVGEVRVVDSVVADNTDRGARVNIYQPDYPSSFTFSPGIVFSVVNSAIRNNGTYGIDVVVGKLRVIDSTITGTKKAKGAGIYAMEGYWPEAYHAQTNFTTRANNRVEIINSTIANNNGIGVWQRAALSLTPTLTIRHSTIIKNGGVTNDYIGRVGGVWVEYIDSQWPRTNVSNSVIAAMLVGNVGLFFGGRPGRG